MTFVAEGDDIARSLSPERVVMEVVQLEVAVSTAIAAQAVLLFDDSLPQ
jgi:hypothetical protein